MVDDALVLDALRAVLQERGEVVVPPAGYSMGARYRRAEGLVLRPPRDPVRVGEVVAYARGARWVLHRVLSVRDGQLLTQGDALGVADEPRVPRDCVEAVLVARICGNRRVEESRLHAWWAVARCRLQSWCRGWRGRQ